MQSMTKIRRDKDVVNHMGPVYAEKEIELSWLIWQGMVYDEDQRG